VVEIAVQVCLLSKERLGKDGRSVLAAVVLYVGTLEGDLDVRAACTGTRRVAKHAHSDGAESADPDGASAGHLHRRRWKVCGDDGGSGCCAAAAAAASPAAAAAPAAAAVVAAAAVTAIVDGSVSRSNQRRGTTRERAAGHH